jgi:hypothetical protein
LPKALEMAAISRDGRHFLFDFMMTVPMGF